MQLQPKTAALLFAGILALGGVAAAQQERFQPDLPAMSLDADPVAPAAAAPEPAKLPWRTFELAGGVSYTSVTTTITVGGGGANASIDAEGVLGMSRDVLCPEVWAAYRFGNTHRIMASFEDMSRTATRSLTRDIDFNGNTYTIGTTIHSDYGLQLYGLAYAWSFLQDDRMDIAITAGFNTIRTHLSISPEDPTRYESERYIIPIPLPGLTADFLLTPSFWLRQRLELMYLPVTNYSGLLVDYKVAVELAAFEHLAFGLGLDLLRVDLQKHSSDPTWGNFDGDFRITGSGVMIYANVHW